MKNKKQEKRETQELPNFKQRVTYEDSSALPLAYRKDRIRTAFRVRPPEFLREVA